MELLNVEEQAKRKFNNVYNCINKILRTKERFDISDLQNIFCKLVKKRDAR